MSNKGHALFDAFSRSRGDYVLLYGKAAGMARIAADELALPVDRIHVGSIEIRDIKREIADGFPFAVYYFPAIDLRYEIVIGWIADRDTAEVEALLLNSAIVHAREAVVIAPRAVGWALDQTLEQFLVNGHLIAIKGARSADVYNWAKTRFPRCCRGLEMTTMDGFDKIVKLGYNGVDDEKSQALADPVIAPLPPLPCEPRSGGHSPDLGSFLVIFWDSQRKKLSIFSDPFGLSDITSEVVSELGWNGLCAYLVSEEEFANWVATSLRLLRGTQFQHAKAVHIIDNLEKVASLGTTLYDDDGTALCPNCCLPYRYGFCWHCSMSADDWGDYQRYVFDRASSITWDIAVAEIARETGIMIGEGLTIGFKGGDRSHSFEYSTRRALGQIERRLQRTRDSLFFSAKGEKRARQIIRSLSQEWLSLRGRTADSQRSASVEQCIPTRSV